MQVFLFADWNSRSEPRCIGTLIEGTNNTSAYAFEYCKSWLLEKNTSSSAPAHHFHKPITEGDFCLYFDSLPDEWGQSLLKRYEKIKAELEGRQQRVLRPLHYLQLILDVHRPGAIRVKPDQCGPFVSQSIGAFQVGFLPSLYESNIALETSTAADNPDYARNLCMMVSAGASLGGRRPKVSVLDRKNQLWIAKLPTATDHCDVGGWEIVLHELASQAGLNVPEARAIKVSNGNHIFLSKRFDRNGRGNRIHYTSTKGLLAYMGSKNLNGEKANISYLDIGELIIQNCSSPKKDLKELWKRIVFNICVKNTNDHLKNHGFLLTEKGWVLSPAFDMNPDPSGSNLKLNISTSDSTLDLGLAMDIAVDFSLAKNEATNFLKTVRCTVAKWQNIADSYGISKAEQAIMAPAFSTNS
jgi:serine/threonine-protein kinase HipA